jgi:hypothetical protein
VAIRRHRSGGLCGYAWKRVDPGGVGLATGLDHHVSMLALPVVILFEQNRADQADVAFFVREYPDHISTPLHLFVKML